MTLRVKFVNGEEKDYHDIDKTQIRDEGYSIDFVYRDFKYNDTRACHLIKNNVIFMEEIFPRNEVKK